MSYLRPCLYLLVAAVVVGCQSAPSTEAARQAAAHSELARAQAHERARQQAGQQQRNEVAEARAADADAYDYAPPPPPAPAAMRVMAAPMQAPMAWEAPNTEHYANRDDNPVRRTADEPVSTFSIDVDTGSYSNVRRMLREGVRPPADAVRAEEFLNYFDHGHPAPASRELPFRVSTELAPAPWNRQRQLLMIGIKGYDVPKATLPASNLVFLLDTSGSMEAPDKLPLLKQAFALLVPQLRAQDRVSIVVYAGSAGLVLPPTPGNRHDDILAALDRLQAGGSTNGGDGIQLAYAMARQAFIPDGNNRIILATDGDFNVGTVDQGALETLVADQRKSGIALTTLGFGQGNYNDAMAEQLADVGDGNHAYIDSLREARKVLVDEMQSTLLTIARDVKIQIEFNPAVVAEYRLIGYENRVLANADFANDKVDAGDIGAGHQVTALYELTPVDSDANRLPALRYGTATTPTGGDRSETAHLRLRYKLPGQERSRLIETPVLASSLVQQPSARLQFAAAVVGYADLLRGGTHVEQWSWPQVAALARQSKGTDTDGLRGEFIEMIEQARALASHEVQTPAIAAGD